MEGCGREGLEGCSGVRGGRGRKGRARVEGWGEGDWVGVSVAEGCAEGD